MTVFPESHLGVHLADPRTLRTLELTADGAGLMLGRNRQRHPVTARLFRPEHTRVLLAGDLRCAQLFAFRALALNAQIIIQSARPAALHGLYWRPRLLQQPNAQFLPVKETETSFQLLLPAWLRQEAI